MSGCPCPYWYWHLSWTAAECNSCQVRPGASCFRVESSWAGVEGVTVMLEGVVVVVGVDVLEGVGVGVLGLGEEDCVRHTMARTSRLTHRPGSATPDPGERFCAGDSFLLVTCHTSSPSAQIQTEMEAEIATAVGIELLGKHSQHGRGVDTVRWPELM